MRQLYLRNDQGKQDTNRHYGKYNGLIKGSIDL